jgi:uncharacterized protein YgbK (DUF1537 family)
VPAAVTVLADDLTGANATGALFARMGLRTRTITGSAAVRETSGGGDAEVTVVTTGTRTMPAPEAAGVVTDLLRSAPALARSRVLAKRVDTTLRGPVAAELDALLAGRRAALADPDRPVVAVAVPAYPSAGRTTVGGIHLLHGVPLAESSAGRDPLTPVRSSRVAELVTAGTGLRAVELHQDVLRSGADGASAAIARALAGGDVVVLDAETEGDLARLATAVARAGQEAGVDVVPVDSGPFAAAYCGALGLRPQRYDAPVLLVVGSTAEPTARQVEHAVESLDIRVVEVDPERDLDADDLVRTTLAHLDGDGRDICWRVAPPQGGLDPGLAAKVPHALATRTREVLDRAGVGGVFACGGEVAAALLEALDVHSLEIEGEVQPLVVTGRVHGGRWDRLPVITKGGMVGDDRAVTAAIGRLHEMHEEVLGTAEDRPERPPTPEPAQTRRQT